MNKKTLEAAKQKNANNPALDIFSGVAVEAERKQATKKQTIEREVEAPAGYKINPQFIETKTKRVQLVFQPSIYNRAKAAADKAGISLNEYLHRLIDENTERED